MNLKIPEGVELPDEEEFELLVRVRKTDAEDGSVEVMEIEGTPVAPEEDKKKPVKKPIKSGGFIDAVNEGMSVE